MLEAFLRLGWRGAQGYANREAYLVHDAHPNAALWVQFKLTTREALSYELDFFLTDVFGDPPIESLSLGIAVEIDGHSFHERTKEQAARDRSRDRALVRDGIRVLQFTGAEAYADADRCAREVVQVYERLRASQIEAVRLIAGKEGAGGLAQG
jgi:hypothetical protein